MARDPRSARVHLPSATNPSRQCHRAAKRRAFMCRSRTPPSPRYQTLPMRSRPTRLRFPRSTTTPTPPATAPTTRSSRACWRSASVGARSCRAAPDSGWRPRRDSSPPGRSMRRRAPWTRMRSPRRAGSGSCTTSRPSRSAASIGSSFPLATRRRPSWRRYADHRYLSALHARWQQHGRGTGAAGRAAPRRHALLPVRAGESANRAACCASTTSTSTRTRCTPNGADAGQRPAHRRGRGAEGDQRPRRRHRRDPASSRSGEWELVQSRYNRRITGATPMEITGPVRGATAGADQVQPGRHPDARHAQQLRPRLHALGHLPDLRGELGRLLRQREPAAQLPREHARYGVADRPRPLRLGDMPRAVPTTLRPLRRPATGADGGAGLPQRAQRLRLDRRDRPVRPDARRR